MSIAAYSQFAALLPFPVLLVTGDGGLVFANAAARELLPLPCPLPPQFSLGDILSAAPPWRPFLTGCAESRELRAGTLSWRLADDGRLETRCDGAVLVPARDSEQALLVVWVHDLHETLEQRVAERTALAMRRESQLRMLACELTRAEQRERRRLARILHDDVQQLLVAAKMHTDVLRPRVADANQDQLRRVGELIDESIRTSRSMTIDLSPPILHDRGLAPALHWLSRWLRDRHRLEVVVDADEAAEPSAEDLAVLLFEATRELLLNIVKHANVQQARVEMCRHGHERVRIRVIDFGTGFDVAEANTPAGSSRGFGLFNVRQRLELLGGEFELHSTAGEGTVATITAPLALPD